MVFRIVRGQCTWKSLSFRSCRAREVQDSLPCRRRGGGGGGRGDTDDACSIDLTLGVVRQLAVGPDSHGQSGHGGSYLADALVKLSVE